jgi:hypothetical protein
MTKVRDRCPALGHTLPKAAEDAFADRRSRNEEARSHENVAAWNVDALSPGNGPMTSQNWWICTLTRSLTGRLDNAPIRRWARPLDLPPVVSAHPRNRG